MSPSGGDLSMSMTGSGTITGAPISGMSAFSSASGRSSIRAGRKSRKTRRGGRRRQKVETDEYGIPVVKEKTAVDLGTNAYYY